MNGPKKTAKNSHFWAFLGFPKEQGHEIWYGECVSDGSTTTKRSAKSDNFEVPKNGPKVAQKVCIGMFLGRNHP